MNIICFVVVCYGLLESFNRLAQGLGVKTVLERLLSSFMFLWMWTIVVSWVLSFMHLLIPEAFGLTALLTVVLILTTIPKRGEWLLVQIKDLFSRVVAFSRSHMVHGVLIAVTLLWFVWATVHFLISPVATFDSLTYHLPMIANWLQHGEISSYETTTIRQIIMPVNTEIFQMFHIIFLGNDSIVEAVQLECLIVSFIGVYIIALKSGLSKGWALNTAVVFLTVPLILMESYTSQNDLAVVAGMTLSLVWLSQYIVERNQKALLLLGISLGLLLGIKFHMLIAVLLFILITAFVFWSVRRDGFRWKHAFIFLLCSIASCVLLGSEIYLRNLRDFKTLIPPIGPIDTHFVIGLSTLLENVEYFFTLWFLKCWDFSSDASWTQDTGHYGPFFGYVIIPLALLSVVFSVVRIYKKQPDRPQAIIILCTFVVVTGSFLGFTLSHRPRPFDLRYLLFIPMILGSVSVWIVNYFAPKLEIFFALLLCLVTLPTTISVAIMHNYPKFEDVYNLEPWQRTASELSFHGPDSDLYKVFNENARAGDIILMCGIEDDWSYPLFGADLSRKVYYPTSLKKFLWYLSHYSVNWIVIREVSNNAEILKYIRSRPSTFELVRDSKDQSGNYFGTTLFLFKVGLEVNNPTWLDGIYGDHLTQKEFTLGSNTPGKFIIDCYVDPIFNDSLRLAILSPGESLQVISLQTGSRKIEVVLKQAGEVKISLNRTYTPLNSPSDTRQLGLSVKSILFEYEKKPVSVLDVLVYP